MRTYRILEGLKKDIEDQLNYYSDEYEDLRVESYEVFVAKDPDVQMIGNTIYRSCLISYRDTKLEKIEATLK